MIRYTCLFIACILTLAGCSNDKSRSRSPALASTATPVKATGQRAIYRNQTFNRPGRALDLEGCDEVLIENCRFENTGGIFIQAKASMTIRVVNNQAINIRKTKGMEYAQFLQVSGCGPKGEARAVPIDLLVQGNVIVNDRGQCDVEDNINLIAVCGTAQRPLRVTGNTITGAWPADTSEESLRDYSGGGIICDRGTSWALIEGNTVRETTNYGIAIAGGTNNVIRGNTVTAKDARNVGIYCANLYAPDPFAQNKVEGNKVAWQTPKGRNDYWLDE